MAADGQSGAAAGAFDADSYGDDAWRPDVDDIEAIIDYYHDRPVAFFEDIGFVLADTQREILNACLDHNRIIVWSGNGTGKTAAVMMAIYWYVMTRWNSLGLVTSGNYAVLNDTSWPFLQTIHTQAQRVFPGIPGDIKQSPPSIDIPGFPEWWLRFRSPKYPENLEGRHGRRAFVVIDEADKSDVTAAHFSSATSTASSDDDIVIAIANPPQDRSNVAFQKWQSDRWHTIEFSSFDSHNVKRSMGALAADDGRGEIPGLVDLSLVIEDYEAWNGYDWPGVDTALQALGWDEHGRRVANPDWGQDLDPRWYRKRLGVLPPSGQGTLRPFYERHVDDAVERYREMQRRDAISWADGQVPVAQFGTDIARDGGDRTVCVGRFDRRTSGVAHPVLDVLLDRRPRDHEVNHDLLMDLDTSQRVRRGPWLVDAVGEGSAVADRLRASRPHVVRFDGGTKAADEARYRNRATEAYAHLGQFLKDGGAIPPNTDLERELREASRVLVLVERPLKGGTVLQAKGKETLKKSAHLGRSPDVLDAAAMACYSGVDTRFEVPNVRGVVG